MGVRGVPTLGCSGAWAVLLVLGVLEKAEVAAQGTTDQYGFEARTFDGTNNNLEQPLWGSTNTSQIRSVAAASYSDGESEVSVAGLPSAREVTTEVFLASPSVRAPQSALFVAWGLLMSYDMFLNVDDDSLDLDVPCDDGGGSVDVWCPEGAASAAIPFFRSQGSTSTSSGVRNPLNLATSYLDLDFMYGRTEAQANELRELEDGRMNLTDDGMPILLNNSTWLIGDQRTAQLPVTFALHIALLREHNRCCSTIAIELGYEGDEEIYQACRGWTIAVYEHIADNDFNVRVAGMDILAEYEPFDDVVSSSYSTPEPATSTSDATTLPPRPRKRRDRRKLHNLYTGSVNPGADVFATTVGTAAFHAAIPPTIRIMKDGYIPADEDGIELTEAAGDIAGLFERNDVGSIIRGAVLSSSLAVDAHFASAVSIASPLFKFPVDAVQRGRDHGLPTYNAAREAYGLSQASTFADVTPDANIQALLEEAYGNDIDVLDAFVGALAESSNLTSTAVFGDLLQEVWKDQLYRTIVGDRLFHDHAILTTDAENTTLQYIMEENLGVYDLPLSLFTVPDISVCYDNCSTSGSSIVALSDEFILAWEVSDESFTDFTLSAKYIGNGGFVAIGFGGSEMATAEDYLICEILGDEDASCLDYQPVSGHSSPEIDIGDSYLAMMSSEVDGDWTSVTFRRFWDNLDDAEDYDLPSTLDGETKVDVVFAYREGDGFGKHPNSNRGAASVNFVTGESDLVCSDDDNFYLLHGGLILFTWLVLLPLGIYYARYRKGEQVFMDNLWWEAHSELMILSSEIVLPLSISAIVSTSGNHRTNHAKWGYYMITAIAMQLITGFLRQRALQGKHANFSLFNRLNKHFHIWAGHFAFLSGVIQCYRGLELVSSEDSLAFSAAEDLVEFEVGTFGIMRDPLFPIWFGILGALFLFLETRKQMRRYSRKGAAMVCCVYELRNKDYAARRRQVEDDGEEEDRLMPRTQALTIYSMTEFNEKVLNGQSWVIVDGAILDVSAFSRRHPGGARVVMNALGTDITNELKGEDLSLGMAMSFAPHVHTETALDLARSMVVGYIDEEDETDSESEQEGDNTTGSGESRGGRGRARAHERKSQQARLGRSEHSRMSTGGSRHSGAGREVEQSGHSGEKPSTEANLRAAMIARAWANKAKRRGSVSAVPMPAVQTALVPAAMPAVLAAFEKCKERKRFILERFHVCPFVLRERLDNGSQDDRAVYRYVFACPGESEILAQAATGVCHFNMRVICPSRESVIQRAYNASAVRVITEGAATSTSTETPAAATGDSTLDVATSARGNGTAGNKVAGAIYGILNPGGSATGGAGGAGVSKDATMRVVPAVESREGTLCVEMRIRLYKDGAMSKLLEQLPNDAVNAAVQLQGPYLMDTLSPPPGHRNVIMIAAGTGINPMVQLIRDYQSFDSEETLRTTGRSRLALLWQVTAADEFYCLDELRRLEARGRGLLEITTLVSGSHRKKNDPKAPNAFQRRRKRRAAAAAAKKTAGGNSGSSTPARSVHGFLSNAGSNNNPSFGSGSRGILGRLLPGTSKSGSSRSADGGAADANADAAAASVPSPVFEAGAPSGDTGTVATGNNNGGVPSDDVLPADVRNAFVDSSSSTAAGGAEKPQAIVAAAPLSPKAPSYEGSHAPSPPRDHGAEEKALPPPLPPRPINRLRALLPGSKVGKVDDASGSPPHAGDVSGNSTDMVNNPREVLRPPRALVHGSHGAPPGSVVYMSSKALSALPPLAPPVLAQQSSLALGPTIGKVSKERIQEVFGGSLLQAVESFKKTQAANPGNSQQGRRGAGWDRDADLAALCGTESESGKLQVVLSGPSGFVFQVETMLEDMGVPREAVMILD